MTSLRSHLPAAPALRSRLRSTKATQLPRLCAVAMMARAILFDPHGDDVRRAGAQGHGSALDQHDATTAGSPQLLVDRPWYGHPRAMAVAIEGGYAHNLLRFPDGAGGWLPATVEHAFRGSLNAAVAPTGWLLFRASLPVQFFESGTADPTTGLQPHTDAALGNPRLGGMLRIWGQPERDAVSLQAGVDVWFRGSDPSTHQADGGIGIQPRFVLAGRVRGRIAWGTEIGFRYREDATLGTDALHVTAGSVVQAGAALGVHALRERLYAGLEARVSTRVTALAQDASNLTRLEILLGAQARLSRGWSVGAGVGGDALAMAGAPDLRALLRLTWAIPPGDRGIATDPRLDSDGDGIPDVRDRCPLEPEDRNGYRQDDGCPESAVAVAAARMLRDPGVSTQTAAQRGAAGPVDRSPSGVHLPPAPPDHDRDGIPDAEDRCPLSPEDIDGFEDDDGCPDPDNDADGIADALDRCPLEAETVNGTDDHDGCPDVASARVRVAHDEIDLREPIQFYPDMALIDSVSLPLLEEIAQTLQAHRELAIEIQGHTDNVGDPRHNLRLSQQRAEQVRTALVQHGVDGTRLVAKGFGASQPRTSNATADGRRQNRRVVLRILRGVQPPAGGQP